MSAKCGQILARGRRRPLFEKCFAFFGNLKPAGYTAGGLVFLLAETQSPMGAPHWGQNLLSEAAPQMGQIFWAGDSKGSSGASPALPGLLASSSAILALEVFTAYTRSRTASGISPSYSLTNHSPMVR